MKQSEMQLLQFASLSHIPNLHHAVITRDGGVSQSGFESLNLAFHVGDNRESVQRNRQILARETGFEIENLVAAQQVHGDKIQVVTEVEKGCGALSWESAISNTDALITSTKNQALLILVADCAPILLVCPQKQVLALVHAGWRGALAGIAGKTVAQMRDDFGCAPENILVGIGPCLSIENLEIGWEIAAQIQKVDAKAIIDGWEKPHLDLRGLIQRDLARAGVLKSNIETMPFCSKHDARFFSHRGQNGVAGRFGIVAFWQYFGFFWFAKRGRNA